MIPASVITVLQAIDIGLTTAAKAIPIFKAAAAEHRDLTEAELEALDLKVEMSNQDFEAALAAKRNRELGGG